MNRKEFYRKYYVRTDRCYMDKTFASQRDKEMAWRRGQYLKTSKFERKLFIIAQYILLALCIIFCKADPFASAVCFFLSILSATVTDFSIIKIELLYRIHRSSGVYCGAVSDIFWGEFDPSIEGLRKLTKKCVGGYYLSNKGTFCGKYRGITRNKSDVIWVIFTCSYVRVKINGKNTVISRKDISREELINTIASVICEYMEK